MLLSDDVRTRRAAAGARAAALTRALATRSRWFWMDDLLRTGSQRPLEQDDLGTVSSWDRAELQYERFQAVW